MSALQDPDAPRREETIARGAATLACKRTDEASGEDVLEIGLYESGVLIEPHTAQGTYTSHRVTALEQGALNR
ncbi:MULTISPECIES: hypothetical protein [Streptomyces]|uniref:hypothetical protein n=1 Tax=Streptomyces TaxID=1883 RepID=UPI0007CD9A54|nr:hypothetical protein A4V12_23180 [Streptomyces noursei]